MSFAGWSFFILTGLTGFAVDYSRPEARVEAPAPVPVELIDVDIAPMVALGSSVAAAQQTAPPAEPLPVPLDKAMLPPSAPALIAVADSSQVAFALPVEGPVRTVAVAQAAYSARRGEGDGSARYGGPVETLVFGTGAGSQPAPHYPWKAVKQGQEGSVSVVFCVGKDGRVVSGETSKPCPWPMLNESALRTVCRRWRFDAGKVRYYEVTIQFELEK